ncbi:MAG: hypothetical protein Q9183_003478 [Haloplaca sp. 2 TL-2023]
MTPLMEPTRSEAPPVNGATGSDPAPTPPEADGAEGDTTSAVEVGYGAKFVIIGVATREGLPLVEVSAAVDDASADAGVAVATQSQTALAAVCTASPVAGPQAEMTQPNAADAMAADFVGSHWQA